MKSTAVHPKFKTDEENFAHCRRVACLKPGDTMFLKDKEHGVMECVFTMFKEGGYAECLMADLDEGCEGRTASLSCAIVTIHMDRPAD